MLKVDKPVKCPRCNSDMITFQQNASKKQIRFMCSKCSNGKLNEFVISEEDYIKQYKSGK